MPAHGEGVVSVSLRELTVKFDQAMNKAQSSVKTPAMPELGEARWTNDRTAVLSVKLEPDREYLQQLNGLGSYGFQNQNGESLKPVMLSFATSRADATERPRSLSTEQNRAAIEELKSVIDLRYAYRDRVSQDWPKHFSEYDAMLLNSRDEVAFAGATAACLATAEDCHIDVHCSEQGFGSHRVPYRINCNANLLPRLIPKSKVHSPAISSGTFDDGIWIHSESTP